jgi:hypothetical protein
MDERTEMIVEVNGVEEIRKIDRIEVPYPFDYMSFGIKCPVLKENEEAMRALPDKVIIIQKYKGENR